MTNRNSSGGAGSSLVTRRSALKLGAAGIAAGSVLGMPGILRAQDVIKVGHLTPKTGFLGVLGEYATLGIKLSVDQINAAGGVNGKMLELISEDSINPDVATTKAQRMIEQDNVDFLIGEISSASARAISQVAERNKKLFIAVGPRSDTLRGNSCSKYMFCTDIPNTVMVNAVGGALKREGMVDGKKFVTLTADYVFGHDLLRAAKAFFDANGGILVSDDLVATDVTDFSPYLLKIRQAQPDVVCLNLAGNQVTNFVKQYAEYGLPFPTVGFNLNTADAWAAGIGNLSGTWPTPWYDTLQTEGSQAYVSAFKEAYGKLPENHSWISFVAMRIMAKAMGDTQSVGTPDLIEYLESGQKFDLLKNRDGYFRAGDHQLIQEAFAFTVDEKAENEHDMIVLGDPVPGPDEPLESIFPTVEQNGCKL
ncbi:ABC transporter substrate-binding protein [Roseibium aggregatum]|uniref:ABC transporter substrate-binding protein n=1 Tax=Roseibium aggregatum TaxID=187304 RepID=A0A926NWU6_9HYPH|nr:ABC transporter substrate-binding protein [Roseibium aggregatum]MBD1548817.1 ABC transporter substrate-binding protein [Roseibium aggregatum]